MAVLERTTRRVRLTEADEQLYAAVRLALEELRAAEGAVKELGKEPSGTLRLNVSGAAESVLRGPLLVRFLTAHRRVRLELIVTEHTARWRQAATRRSDWAS